MWRNSPCPLPTDSSTVSQEAQPSRPSPAQQSSAPLPQNGSQQDGSHEDGAAAPAEAPADANGTTDEIRTVTAGDTPYTSAVSFDDLPLSEELKKVHFCQGGVSSTASICCRCSQWLQPKS